MDRTYLLTPETPESLENPSAREFIKWIEKIGAVPVVLSPTEHDRVVALTSHLPQLLSTTLASVLTERLTRPEHLRAGGPGLADMTRLAGSSWEIWEDILSTNTDAIGTAVDGFIDALQAVRADLTGEAARTAFASGAGFRARLRR